MLPEAGLRLRAAFSRPRSQSQSLYETTLSW